MKRFLAVMVVFAMLSQLVVLPVFAKQSPVTMTFDDVDISGGDVAIKDLNVDGVWTPVGTGFDSKKPGFYSPGGADYTKANGVISNVDGIPALKLTAGTSTTDDTIIRKVGGADADDSYIHQTRNATTYVSFKQKFSEENQSGGYMRLAFDQNFNNNYTLYAGVIWANNKYVLHISHNNSAVTTAHEIKKGVMYNYLVRIVTRGSGGNDEIYVKAWPEGESEPLEWMASAAGGKANACPLISFKSAGLIEPVWADLKYEVYSDSGEPATSATDVTNAEVALAAAIADGTTLADAETAVAAIPESSVAYNSFMNRLIQIRANNDVTKAVSGLDMNTDDYYTESGEPLRLNAVITPADATNKKINYASSNPDVATVDQVGVVHFVASGSADITATTEDGGFEKVRRVSFDKTAVTGVELSATAKTLKTFEQFQLTASVTPADASNRQVRWASSNPVVATIDNAGVINALTPGETTITVTTSDGGFTAQCVVTVEYVAPESVTLSQSSITLAKGKASTITATVLPEYTSDKSITWSTSDEQVAKVSDVGKITAVAPGDAVITATLNDGGIYATVNVKVIVDVSSVTFEEGTAKTDLVVGDTFQLTPVITPAEAIPYVTTVWESANPSYVSVDDNGLIKVKGVTSKLKINYKVTNDLGTKTATFLVTSAIPDADYPANGESMDVTVTADPLTNGSPSWKSATLTGTATEGVYIITNNDEGAGYSFTWTPATQTISAHADSATAAQVVIPSVINGVNVLQTGSNVIPVPTEPVLETLIISDGISLIGADAFYNHKLLSSVKLPKDLVKIDQGAFRSCSALASINLPEGLKWLEWRAFRGSGLVDVVLPSTLDSNITSDLFHSCQSIRSVTYMGYVKRLRMGSFYDTHHTLETLTFMNETAPSIAETGLFRADATYNITVYYPKNGTGYDTDQFRNMFPANTVFKYLGETSVKLTGAVQNDNTYTIHYELTVDDDAVAQDAVVWLALYYNNALVQLDSVAYDSTQAVYNLSKPVDTVKMFVFNKDMQPMCLSSLARVTQPVPRGRVVNSEGTIKTSNGELLRGVQNGMDPGASAMSYNSLALLKDYGLNSLHLYGERPGAKLEAGYNAKGIDEYVALTEELGLYLILTSGDSTLDEDFSMDFWSFYGERYKDKTHVLFEIQNESNGFGPPTESYLASLKKIYHHLRGIAPESHILLFSFSHLRSVEDIDGYMAALDIDDWSKTAIAWHGYDVNPREYAQFFNYLKDNGYASMNTEVPLKINNETNPLLIKTLEDLGCSWNNFLGIKAFTNDKLWKNPVEKGGIYWKSEYGTWPVPYLNSAFLETEAESHLYSDCTNKQNGMVCSIDNGDYLAYSNINFVDGPQLVDVYAASNAGGTIKLYLDSPDSGTLIGTCEVPAGDGATVQRYSCPVTDATGVHTLYLVFEGEGENLMQLDRFVFGMNPLSAFDAIQAEKYDVQDGLDLGACYDTGGTMSLGAIQEGDYGGYFNIDFGNGASRVEVRSTGGFSDCDAEFRIDSVDGPVIASCRLKTTGGWNHWQTFTADVTAEVTGRHDLYVIFKNGNGHLGGFCNVNWYQFYE